MGEQKRSNYGHKQFVSFISFVTFNFINLTADLDITRRMLVSVSGCLTYS